ncbi:MAG: hypothetical protein H6721_09025 [Sandaracinus sp.]|nr:hypothetical protein [Myxococcales bacterium]MCB9599484.1 hypothetical protein [Sandaracinus sp.]MCB9611401.1 hypothetical protein [Sandaracinus sp.]MCB9621760.1 hypothetical protein [Sandaracinus sp.]MCB9632259.1 hypothetical protein [Sandaracinus sp.]
MPEPSTPERDRGLRVVLPIAVGLVVAAAWVSDRGVIRHDLQIVAPNHAAAGDTLPVRAFLFERNEGIPEPHDLARARVELVPLGSERVVARSELVAGEVLGLEGALTLPDDLPDGDYRVLGRATVDDKALLVSRRVHVHAPPELMERRGRLQTDPQRFELGPKRVWNAHDDETMGTTSAEIVDLARLEAVPLEVRVEGGDCSPPGPCGILVHVGSEPMAVRLRERGEWLEAGPECDGVHVRAGLVRCVLEGSANARVVDAVALDDGHPFAWRRVQLPLGTAAPALTGVPGLVAPGTRPSFTIRGPLDEPSPFVIDLFHDERWLHTESVRVGPDEPVTPRRALDLPGLWRVQVRTEPFGATHAATRFVFVGDLAALERSGYPEAWQVPWVRDEDPDRAARFLLAVGELELVTMPGLTRGAQQAEAGLHETQGVRRWSAAALILLAGLLVAWAIVRRGLTASRQAARLLEAAGGEAAPASRAPIFGAGLFTLALFAAVAALVLSRGCL